MGKGVVNNEMSNFMFRMLEKEGIPTHYIEELNERETAVKKVAIVPLGGHHPQRSRGQPLQAPGACPRAPAQVPRAGVQL